MKSVRSIFFSFPAVLLWLLLFVQVDAQSRIEEVRALMSFSSGLFVDAPYLLTWKENDENACSWVGVTCSPNYTVEALDLSGWGLTDLDSFSPLSQLPDLRQLDISSNAVQQGPDVVAIPYDIGSLTQLSRLDLSGSFLKGSIPSSISACRSLRFLSLERIGLTDTIPDLRELVDLQFLLLADNQLSGSFPSELGNMSNLVTIDISRNQLSGTIPSLLNSTNLETLLLDNNSFVAFAEPLYINAPNLTQLSVSGNQLQGTIPLALADMPKLLTLDMSSNHLSGRIPSGLSNVTSEGFVLDLSRNNLSGSIPVDLIQPNPISASSINLSYNHLNGSIPTPTRKQYVYFQSLDLSHNQLSGSIPVSLSYWEYLNLAYNFLTGDIVEVFVANPDFGGANQLFLGNNYLTGDLSMMISEWSNWDLEVLDLSNNNLSWTASKSIPDPIGAALNNINFNEFWVGGNNFLGTYLPSTTIVNVSGLVILDFSNSQLEGSISADVFNSTLMSQLQILNLSHNSATGPVPESITTFPNLFVLDLSYNNLSGRLPYIPPNSPLNHQSFFEGNEGLCGYPLTDCPQVIPIHGTPIHGTVVQWWVLLIIIGGSVIIVVVSCSMVIWRWRVYHKLHEQDADLIRTLMEREVVTLMPLRNLKKATNNFDEGGKIGEGGFGTLYGGTLNDGTKVAIKRSKREGSEKDKEQFLNEVRILSQVNHRHLVKLMGCCMENKVALLVFEFISNGTLQDHLCGKIGDGHLSWKQRLNIAVQTADALNYLHSAMTFPIYHRDVKSANILLNDDLSAKVADFGISKLAPNRGTHVSTAIQGTMGYMDPEYWISFQLTEKSDVYSFGVVLLELVSGKQPIDFQRVEEETSLVIFARPYIESENLEPLIDPTLMGTYDEQDGHGKKSILDVGRLAMRCVDLQSNARPSMTHVWKELQDICLEFEGTFTMQKDVGNPNRDHDENPFLDSERSLSQLAFDNGCDHVEQYHHARSLELAQFSCSPSLKSMSKSMSTRIFS